MDTGVIVLVIGLCMVLIPLGYVGLKSANRSEKLREQGLEFEGLFSYEGGLDGVLPENLANLEVFTDCIKLILSKKDEYICYSQIQKVKIMSRTQVESYVSSGRLAMFGVLSLAMKKNKNVDMFYTIIELKDNQSIILSTKFRNKCEKVYEYLNKNLQNYNLSN
ncbi:MAG: hypothetical protein KHZ90_09920 [Veillonella parvula]|uniref:Uncharacterized protein n=1 Tax=Veillonella parvula TaxID=29466 RepID=A0A942WRD7_VEIPA|nr:hypothetical protein [Veillonella parvula]MBS4894073.1 hypothetical protein [Veillonella parvula]